MHFRMSLGRTNLMKYLCGLGVICFSLSLISLFFVPRVSLRDSAVGPTQLAAEILTAAQNVFARLPKSRFDSSPFGYSITIVTAKRDQAYLIKVVSSLLSSFGETLPRILLCNTESDASNDATLAPFTQYLTVHNVYDGIPALPKTTLSERIAKEAHDYWACLNRSLSETSVKHVLLLEDDAEAHENLKELLYSLLLYLEWREGNERLRHSPIHFVKLYHPNRLRKIPAFPMICSLSFLLCLSLTACTADSSQQFFFTLLGSFFLSIFMVTVIEREFMSDARHWLSGGRAYLSQPESCCTPAILFRSSAIPRIVRDLSSQTAFQGHAKDHILDAANLNGRSTDMNFFRHIGRVSSLRRGMA